MLKTVVVELSKGKSQEYITVTVEIDEHDGKGRSSCKVHDFPQSPEVETNHDKWQTAYRQLDTQRRLGVPQARTSKNPQQQCSSYAQALKNSMQNWYEDEKFKKIRDTIYTELNRHDEIRLLIQTDDSKLRQLPWHLFFDSFLDKYRKAEIAISPSEYDKPNLWFVNRRNKIRILAILGDSTGINVQQDKQELINLPDNPDIEFLVEPSPIDLDEKLRDEQGWDILFFAGHSHSDQEAEKGYINLNKNKKLEIKDLKHSLIKALEKGLQLAIFNSCDGLGLAQQLAELHIPQTIVMREPVPDRVAQAFLKYFLEDFSGGKSLYLSVREARERLTLLELQYEIPNASWLPVICQMPNNLPRTWRELCGVTQSANHQQTSKTTVETPTQPNISTKPPTVSKQEKNKTSSSQPPTTKSPTISKQENNKTSSSQPPTTKSPTISKQENNRTSSSQPPTTPNTPKTTASPPINAKNFADEIKICEASLQKNPEDATIRSKYLGLISRYGTAEQKLSVIEQTKSWLLKNYSTWQKSLPQDAKMRQQLIPLLGNFIHLALDNYRKNRDIYQILFQTFGRFRDYLNEKDCDLLANFIAEYPLDIPIIYWEQIVNSANILRDFQNKFDVAEKMYLQVLQRCEAQQKKSGANIEAVNKTMRYAKLNLARLLILRPSPQPDAAIKHLEYVIKDDISHSLAHLYLAQCYEKKGEKFHDQATRHYQQAIRFDQKQTGYFLCEFGRFFRESCKNTSLARKCFTKSIEQNKNLRACVELADLDAAKKDFASARNLLQEARKLERLTRWEKQQWRELEQRIKNIDSRIVQNLGK